MVIFNSYVKLPEGTPKMFKMAIPLGHVIGSGPTHLSNALVTVRCPQSRTAHS